MTTCYRCQLKHPDYEISWLILAGMTYTLCPHCADILAATLEPV